MIEAAQILQQFTDNPRLKVLFLFDPEGTYADEVKELSIEDVSVVMAEKASFSLKYKLSHEWADQRVFLYLQQESPQKSDDWEHFTLNDVLLANKEWMLDPVANFMEEYKLPHGAQSLVQQYYPEELRHKNRQKFLAPILSSSQYTNHKLKRGLLAYHLEAKVNASDAQLLAAFFNLTKEAFYTNSIQRLVELDLLELLQQLVSNYWGALPNQFNWLDSGLAEHLAHQFKYLILTYKIDKLPSDTPYYEDLHIDNVQQRDRLVQLYLEWRENIQLETTIDLIMDHLALQVDEQKLVDYFGYGVPYGYYSKRLQRSFLEACTKDITTNAAKVHVALQHIKNQPELQGKHIATTDFLLAYAQFMQAKEAVETWVLNTPTDYIKQYTSSWYRFDQLYRKAVDHHAAWRRQGREVPDIEPLIEHLDAAYDDVVYQMNYEWQRCFTEKGGSLKKLGVPLQCNFYKDRVQPFKKKLAVIISDAFRYECADELSDLLQKDEMNRVTAEYQLASIPSITKVGMANLLPHKALQFEGDKVLVDHEDITGLPAREKVLKKHNPNSLTIQYNALKELNKEQGRELLKGVDLIYVYHNKIDDAGDKSSRETEVFHEVSETLVDLEMIYRKLAAWNVRDVLITADHGFLFSRTIIEDRNKESFPQIKGTLHKRSRAMVAPQIPSDEAGYHFSLAEMVHTENELQVLTPRANNRFSLPGAGTRYVHGGGSLQELVVPVLSVERLRKNESIPVPISLITEIKAISNRTIALEYLQEQPVGEQYRGQKVKVALYNDENDRVSNEMEIHFNSTSDKPTDRIYKVQLVLTQEGSDALRLHLKYYKEGDYLNPLGSKLLINNLLMKPDF